MSQPCLDISALDNTPVTLLQPCFPFVPLSLSLVGRAQGHRLRRKRRGLLPSAGAGGHSPAECSSTMRVRGWELCHLERSWQHSPTSFPQGGSRVICKRRASPVRVTSLPYKTSGAFPIKVTPLLPQLSLKTIVPSTLLSLWKRPSVWSQLIKL